MNAFIGSATSTSYSMPGNGVNVPLQATFKKFFNTFIGSLNNPAANSYPGAAGGTGQFPGGGFPGAQGFPQAGFPGQLPMLPSQIAGFRIQNQTSKHLKSQAFAPGSVLVDSVQPQIGTVNPFQGFAGQNGTSLTPGIFPGGGISSIGTAGQFSSFPAYQQGSGAKLPFLIMPIISLFGLLKSMLSFRKLAGYLTPEKVDKQNLNYNTYQSYLNKAYEDGNFDEPELYKNEQTIAQNNFNYSDNLQGF